MEFFVDIADIEKVENVMEYFPIDGVTTNPNILTKSAKTLSDLLKEYERFAKKTGLKIFIEVTAEKAEEMVQ